MGAGVWLSLTLPVPRSRMSPSPWRSLSCGHTVTSSTCAAWRPSCGAWMRGSGQPMGPSQLRASRWVLRGSGQRSREEWGMVPISFKSGLTSGKTDGWLGSRLQYRPNVKGHMCIKGVKWKKKGEGEVMGQRLELYLGQRSGVGIHDSFILAGRS